MAEAPLLSSGRRRAGRSRLTRIMRKVSSSEMARTAVPAPPKPDLPEPASYELALAELDQLVQQMESGALPLDQLLAGYKRGALLLAFCRLRLQAVEEQVKVLEDGQLKPWAIVS